MFRLTNANQILHPRPESRCSAMRLRLYTVSSASSSASLGPGSGIRSCRLSCPLHSLLCDWLCDPFSHQLSAPIEDLQDALTLNTVTNDRSLVASSLLFLPLSGSCVLTYILYVAYSAMLPLLLQLCSAPHRTSKTRRPYLDSFKRAAPARRMLFTCSVPPSGQGSCITVRTTWLPYS